MFKLCFIVDTYLTTVFVSYIIIIYFKLNLNIVVFLKASFQECHTNTANSQNTSEISIKCLESQLAALGKTVACLERVTMGLTCRQPIKKSS